MSRQLISTIFGLAILSGCSSMGSKQQALIERGARPPDVGATLIRRSVGENGVTCQFSDGTVVRRQNRAAPCF